jgi:hypothetical protein
MARSNPLVLVVAGVASLVGIAAGYFIARGTLPDTPAPAAVKVPAPGPGLPDLATAHTPIAPGTPNAIAALATKDGGEPTRPTAVAGTGPRRGLAAFTVGFDAAAPDAAWTCTAAAGSAAAADLAAGTVGVSSAPISTSPCGGAGGTRLDGRVRLATRTNTTTAGAKAEPGERCDATLAYTLRRADGSNEAKELQASAVEPTVASACDTALHALEPGVLKVAGSRAGG